MVELTEFQEMLYESHLLWCHHVHV